MRKASKQAGKRFPDLISDLAQNKWETNIGTAAKHIVRDLKKEGKKKKRSVVSFCGTDSFPQYLDAS